MRPHTIRTPAIRSMESNMTQSFTTHLKDADPESSATLQVKVTCDDSSISIFPNGYGDCGSEPGYGCPVFLELYQGHLRLIVFQDINEQNPVIIDLENAREEKFISGDEDTGNIITTEPKRINNEENR